MPSFARVDSLQEQVLRGDGLHPHRASQSIAIGILSRAGEWVPLWAGSQRGPPAARTIR